MTETLTELKNRRIKLRAELVEVSDLLRAAALERLAAGDSEAGVARDAGVDRMTVRQWLGKR
jgi:hypothetical protein